MCTLKWIHSEVKNGWIDVLCVLRWSVIVVSILTIHDSSVALFTDVAMLKCMVCIYRQSNSCYSEENIAFLDVFSIIIKIYWVSMK